MEKIFISHSSKDKDFVDKLIAELEHLKLDFWYDKWEIKTGDSILDKLSDGLSKADGVLIVLSENSIKSNWVKEELKIALNKRISNEKIKILPIRIDNCDIPIFLSDTRYADFSLDYDTGLSDLIRSLLPTTNFLNNQLEKLSNQISLLLDSEILLWESLISPTKESVQISHDFEKEFISLMDKIVDIKFYACIKKNNETVNFSSDFFHKFEYLKSCGIDVVNQFWARTLSAMSISAHDSSPENRKRILYVIKDDKSIEYPITELQARHDNRLSLVLREMDYAKVYISEMENFQRTTLQNIIKG
jgi:hypothetical protein